MPDGESLEAHVLIDSILLIEKSGLYFGEDL